MSAEIDLLVSVEKNGILRLREVYRHQKTNYPMESMLSGESYPFIPKIEKVYRSYDKSDILSGLCGFESTTVVFSDGTKTTVKRKSGDFHDPEKAILFCIAKRIYGTGEGGFHSEIKKAVKMWKECK